MASRASMVRVLRIVPLAAMLALALLQGALPVLRSVAPVLAASGGCSPATTTPCLLFTVILSGSGSGTLATVTSHPNPIDHKIECRYADGTMTGVCEWGYNSPEQGVIYGLTADAGSQVCDVTTCYGPSFQTARVITVNWTEDQWRFELINPIDARVELTGTGKGTVTSAPAGIKCPKDCEGTFPGGNEVTFFAEPAAGSVFAGWSEDCSGTAAVCSFNLGNPALVIARFNKRATPPPPSAPQPTSAPTPAPEPTPMEAVTAPPPSTTPTPEPSIADATPTVTAAPQPSPVPESTAASSDDGRLLVAGALVVLLVLLAGGAMLAQRRRQR